MPIACRIARSCANELSLPAAIISPAIATTKVLPWYAWMCGATARNQGTKVWGKTRSSVMLAPTLPLVAAPRGGARLGSDVILASRELEGSCLGTSAGGG